MTIYLSGPMTGYVDHNFPAFNEAAERLREAGFEVLNPASQGIVEGWEWEDYLRHDLRAVLAADGVATLPGWRKSRGARLEVHVASQLGMPVMAASAWLRQTQAVAA